MSVKRRSGGSWKVADIRRRYTGGQWVDIGRGYAIHAGGNRTLWDSVTVYSSVFSITGKHMYEYGGVETLQMTGTGCVIQGGTGTQNYTTLMFFDFEQIRGVLANASNISASLYLKRDSIGSSNVNARIYYGVKKTGAVTQKYSDFDYYVAVPVQWETVAKGSGKWVTLSQETAIKLREGEIGCLVLMGDAEKLQENYMRVDPEQFSLKFEYTL